MKFIGLGANLPSKKYGRPKDTLIAAIEVFSDWNITVTQVSSWYESAPIPVSDQPWYINAIAEVETVKSPHELLKSLLAIEEIFERTRSFKNAARTIDLDLIAYDKVVIEEQIVDNIAASIPHPRMMDRSFVLEPIRELCPEWIHPKFGIKIETMINALSKKQQLTA